MVNFRSDAVYYIKYFDSFLRGFKISRRHFRGVIDSVRDPAEAMRFPLERALVVLSLLTLYGNEGLSIIDAEEVNNLLSPAPPLGG